MQSARSNPPIRIVIALWSGMYDSNYSVEVEHLFAVPNDIEPEYVMEIRPQCLS